MADINNAVRTVVLFGLGKIPEAGGLISGLVGVLWPATKEDVWSSIRANVEALIGQRLDEYKYQDVSEDLQGLRNVIADYTKAVNDSKSDPEYISDKYTAALSHFEAAQPHFQAQGFELLLLPLFAQFANLHLSLLRDGVTFGASWGWTPQAVADEETKLQTAVYWDVKWAWDYYQYGLDHLTFPDDTKYRVERWRGVNQYTRRITLDVLDHAHYWQFFDPQVSPPSHPTVSHPTRTLYSDPHGTADDTGISIPDPPTEAITGIKIWGGDFVDAIQVEYGGVLGPQQGAVPSYTGGSNEPPQGWNGAVDPVRNPIVRVTGRSGDMPDTIQLWFRDGSSTNLCGRLDSGAGPYDHSFEDHILSSIHVMGISNYYGSANCIVFGFRLWKSYFGIQDHWRWCRKCQGLFYDGLNSGVCPAQGGHDATGSANYILDALPYAIALRDEAGWRWCNRCQGLFYSGHNSGCCPAQVDHGGHDATESGNYKLGTAGVQPNWFRCSWCQGLFYWTEDGGVCPNPQRKGQGHESSDDFVYLLTY